MKKVFLREAQCFGGIIFPGDPVTDVETLLEMGSSAHVNMPLCVCWCVFEPYSSAVDFLIYIKLCCDQPWVPVQTHVVWFKPTESYFKIPVEIPEFPKIPKVKMCVKLHNTFRMFPFDIMMQQHIFLRLIYSGFAMLFQTLAMKFVHIFYAASFTLAYNTGYIQYILYIAPL